MSNDRDLRGKPDARKRERPVRRPGTGEPTAARQQDVPSPTSHLPIVVVFGCDNDLASSGSSVSGSAGTAGRASASPYAGIRTDAVTARGTSGDRDGQRR